MTLSVVCIKREYSKYTAVCSLFPPMQRTVAQIKEES